MPMKWVKPQRYMTYKNVKVYHCYRDSIDNVQTYWYTTDAFEDDHTLDFDVRTLPGYTDDQSDHKWVIRQAITAAIIKQPRE